VKVDEMAGVCSTHGDMRNEYKIFVGTPEKKRQQEDLDIDGSMILRRVLEKQDGVIWTGFDWDQWRALVNTIMNLHSLTHGAEPFL
jgi:hypothetical protein